MKGTASAKRASMRLKRLSGRIRAAGALGAYKAAKLAEREALRLSSGTLTRAEKRSLGYPYATRWGGARVPGDPAIINEETGMFKRYWRVARSRDGATLSNESPQASYLTGKNRPKSSSIYRPTRERVVERTEYLVSDIVSNEIRRAAKRA